MGTHITYAITVISKASEHFGKIGVVVDYSDSHGDYYGVVFPNFRGSYGRKDSLEVVWFEPNEIENYAGVTQW